MTWVLVWKYATGPLFPFAVGIMYLAGKIVVRHVIHSLVTYEYDVWAMMAWLGVDLAVLSLSVAIGTEIDARFAFDRHQTVMFFFCLLACTLATGVSYGLFIKRRIVVRNRPAIADWRLAWWLTCSWFFGFLQFVPIVRGLLRSIRGGSV